MGLFFGTGRARGTVLALLDVQRAREWCAKILTVLLARLRTRQLKYADLPSNAVTLFAMSVSKYGLAIELSDGWAVLPLINVLMLPLDR